MSDECMMAGCGQEIFGSGLCIRHHCQAYPDERGMAFIRDHVARENAIHPLGTEFARRLHARSTDPPTEDHQD